MSQVTLARNRSLGGLESGCTSCVPRSASPCRGAIILCLLCTDGSIDLGRGSLLNLNDGEGTSTIGRLTRALQMESYPKFHNEVGVAIVRVGCREFKCIGDKPPQDHPHIY